MYWVLHMFGSLISSIELTSYPSYQKARTALSTLPPPEDDEDEYAILTLNGTDLVVMETFTQSIFDEDREDHDHPWSKS